MRKIISVTVTLIVLIPNALGALDLGFAKEDGGIPGAFLNYGAGARSLAMGKTFVGVADDASATYWNPAGLARLSSREVTALYASLYEQTGYSFVSYAHPLAKYGTLGIAVVNLASGGFPLRDEFNFDKGVATLSETAAIFSYGRTIARETCCGRSLSAGVNLKMVNQNIDSVSGTGYGLDLGLFWAAGDTKGRAGILAPLSVGLAVQNVVAPTVKLQSKADTYPFAVTLGFGYRFFDDKLLIALDTNKTGSRQPKVHLGGEYLINHLFAFRLGLDETELASGIGFTWREYSLDYAFAYHDAASGSDNLGISHRFGITAKF